MMGSPVASGMEIQCRGLATRFLVDDDLGWHCLRSTREAALETKNSDVLKKPHF